MSENRASRGPYWYGTGLMSFEDLLRHLEQEHETRRQVALASNVGTVHFMQHTAWGPAGHEHPSARNRAEASDE